MPASATACITGPNAAFATNGSADTARPRAIDAATAPLTSPSMAALRRM